MTAPDLMSALMLGLGARTADAGTKVAPASLEAGSGFPTLLDELATRDPGGNQPDLMTLFGDDAASPGSGGKHDPLADPGPPAPTANLAPAMPWVGWGAPTPALVVSPDPPAQVASPSPRPSEMPVAEVAGPEDVDVVDTGADLLPTGLPVAVLAKETHFAPVERARSAGANIDRAREEIRAVPLAGPEVATVAPAASSGPADSSAREKLRQVPDAETGRARDASRPTEYPAAAVAEVGTRSAGPAKRGRPAPTQPGAAAAPVAPGASPPPQRSVQGARGRAADNTAAAAVATPAAPADNQRAVQAVDPSPQHDSSGGGGDGERQRSHAPESLEAVTDASTSEPAKAISSASGPIVPPSYQIAGRVVAAALAPAPETQRTAAAPATTSTPPVIKVLHIELQPADLGSITIRLALKEDALDIRLKADRHETAAMLQQDQEALSRLLTSAGCRVESMTVMATGEGSGAADGRVSLGLPAAAPDQWTSFQADARSGGGRQGSLPDPHAYRRRERDGEHDASSSVRGAGRGLYL